MSPRSAAAGAAVCLLGLVVVCHPSVVGSAVAAPRKVEEAWIAGVAPPRARVLGGLILRDAATREAIRATAATPLPALGPLHLVVIKSRYRMDVWEGAWPVKVYPVALGADAVRPKERQGDGRTPLGDYLLFPHHESPAFGPSFYVAYPGPMDARHGLERGIIDREVWRRVLLAHEDRLVPPADTELGGLILLHGTRDRTLRGLTRRNWTQGCIAMENPDLEELLAAFTPEDRPVLTLLP